MEAVKEIFGHVVPKRGDANGVVQLFFDNLGTVLALVAALKLVFTGFYNDGLMAATEGPFAAIVAPAVFGTIDDVIFARALPGLGLTMVFGNVYYSWMGARLAAKEGRTDVTALPYGVNTPAAFAFVFSIIQPALFSQAGVCLDNFIAPTSEAEAQQLATCWEDSIEYAWKVGVVSNMFVGILSVVFGIFGDLVLRVTPAATLLTSLAGIGVAFLGISQATATFANPVVGLLPLYLMAIGYFADVKFSGPIPISLVIITVGVILGACDEVVTKETLDAAAEIVDSYGATFAGDALGDWSEIKTYIGITFPVALAAAAGTLMNVMSAKKAGDSYPLKEAMISDGVGTMVGALFGTPFGTSVYIGHPAYKKFGAGTLYSVYNCIIFFFFSMFGIFAVIQALVPAQATAPLLIYVGFSICKEALEEMPQRQYPTFIFGILPALADWATGLNNASIADLGLQGMAKSSILLALVQSTIWFYIIERKFKAASLWAVFATFLAAFGVIHQPEATVDSFDTEQLLLNPDFFQTQTQLRFMIGYLLVTAALVILALLQHFTGTRFVPAEQEPFVPSYAEESEKTAASGFGVSGSQADEKAVAVETSL